MGKHEITIKATPKKGGLYEVSPFDHMSYSKFARIDVNIQFDLFY